MPNDESSFSREYPANAKIEKKRSELPVYSEIFESPKPGGLAELADADEFGSVSSMFTTLLLTVCSGRDLIELIESIHACHGSLC